MCSCQLSWCLSCEEPDPAQARAGQKRRERRRIPRLETIFLEAFCLNPGDAKNVSEAMHMERVQLLLLPCTKDPGLTAVQEGAQDTGSIDLHLENMCTVLEKKRSTLDYLFPCLFAVPFHIKREDSQAAGEELLEFSSVSPPLVCEDASSAEEE